MSRPCRYSFLMAAVALLLGAPLAAQQQNSDSAQPSAPSTTQQKKQDKQSNADRKQSPESQGSAAQQNPFPEAQSEKAARQAQQDHQPQQAQHPDQQQNPPSAPAPQPKRGTSAADQNPFPEAESEKAAKEAQQHQNAAPGDQNPGNSQNSSSSAVPDLNLPAKPGKPGAALVLNTSLGRQDTKIGDFYLQSGDWKGAYSRFIEATQVDPGDAEAVYGLAESARHLGYRKVAIQNYQLYLSALPNGHRAKDCRKALKEMGAQR